MDLKKKKKSKNFIDKTGQDELQKFLDGILIRLNPVTAYRNVRRKDGVIPASHGINIRKR